MSDHRKPTNLEVLRRMREQLHDMQQEYMEQASVSAKVLGEMGLQLQALDYGISCCEMVEVGKC